VFQPHSSNEFNLADFENGPKAVKTLKQIESHLAGRVGDGPPISTEGQVEKLIKEAVSVENLAEVRFGNKYSFFYYFDC